MSDNHLFIKKYNCAFVYLPSTKLQMKSKAYNGHSLVGIWLTLSHNFSIILFTLPIILIYCTLLVGKSKYLNNRGCTSLRLSDNYFFCNRPTSLPHDNKTSSHIFVLQKAIAATITMVIILLSQFSSCCMWQQPKKNSTAYNSSMILTCVYYSQNYARIINS